MEDLSTATESGDTLEMTKADLAFHSALLRASGNSVIVQIGRVIEPALRRRDELTMHDRKKEDLTFLPMHEAIISAIERREPDEAAAAALRLIAESGTDSAEALRQ
jgi:DNA-binding FadR family transcriptional regulator